jgi:hypothetical protein
MNTLDITLLVELNRWLAGNDAAYELAYFAVQYAVYVAAMLIIIVLWFSGKDDPDNVIHSPRGVHRQRAVFFLLLSLTSLLIARGLAASGGRMAPALDVLTRSPETILIGTYPADITAFWMALVLGLAIYYHPAPGVLAALVGGIICGLAVAVGLYYPLDLVAGMAVGAIVFSATWWLRRWLRLPIRMIILGVRNYSSVFYPFGTLIMLDSAQQFLGVSQFIEWLFRVSLVR